MNTCPSYKDSCAEEPTAHSLPANVASWTQSYLMQVDAVTAEEQKVIAFSDKTDIGRVMMNDDTRSVS